MTAPPDLAAVTAERDALKAQLSATGDYVNESLRAEVERLRKDAAFGAFIAKLMIETGPIKAMNGISYYSVILPASDIPTDEGRSDG